jgi:tetratricopeptide (TPR) repeat protein
LKRATVLKPDSARAFNYLGIAYFMRNNLDEARACFQKALEINPDYAAAHCNLGDLQFKEGKADLAVDTLSKALAAIGDNVMLHFTLGNILLHKGEIDEGFAHLGKVMDLDPGYLDRERGFAVEASESNLPQPEMFFRYACLYAANGNLGKTLEFLEKARKAGFSEWKRILHDDAFARFRDDPQIKKYIE